MEQDTIRRVFMPYCLERLKDGRYIVLNRLYKPLGIASRQRVDYDAHPSAMKIEHLTSARVKRLSHKGDDDLGHIHLYGDGCIPTDSDVHWEAYSQRLKLLAELMVEIP